LLGIAPVPAQATPAASPTSGGAFLLELPAPALIDFYARQLNAAETDMAGALAATQAHMARIMVEQQQLAAAVELLGGQILYRSQRVYNGVAVHLATAELAAAAALPGVKAVHRIIPKVIENASSVPFLRVPQLWSGGLLPGVTGRGMRIAVIDTGIDYLHKDFGNVAPAYLTNDKTTVGDVAGFPSAKIPAGYDFTGDNYNADPAAFDFQPIPRPDPDPMDCYGHGSHVAGTAAGYGVTLSGATYGGPYSTATTFNTFKIGPGVAPEAQLIALKVFGCTGSTDITDVAIEWATDPNGDGDFSDRVDVINMSLGSAYGRTDDTTTLAAERAAQLGILVVASAGNSGDSYFALGSPSTGSRIISVANSRNVSTQVAVFADIDDTLANSSARGPRRSDGAGKPDIAAPGTNIVSVASGSGNGSRINTGTSMAAPHVAGAMALLRQLHPGWTAEELKALVMNSAMAQVRLAAGATTLPYSALRTGAGRLDLVAAAKSTLLAYNSDDAGLVSLAFGMPEVLTTWYGLRNLRIANRGAATETLTVTYNPIVDMPGVTVTLPAPTITLAAAGSADLPVMVTAEATLLHRTPDATISLEQTLPRHYLSEEAGALLVWPGLPVISATLAGGGLATAVTTAAGGGGNFRYDPVSRTLGYTVTLSGLPAADVTSVQIAAGFPGKPATALLALGEAGSAGAGLPLTGSLVISAATELLLSSGGLALVITTLEHPDGELRGALLLDRPVARVPLQVAPRPVAAMRTLSISLDFSSGTQPAPLLLRLAGAGISSTAAPSAAFRSEVTALQLQVQSPNGRPAGLLPKEPDLYDHADIALVGIGSTLPQTGAAVAGDVAGATVVFGVATHAPWMTPNELTVNIWVDSDMDGDDDYRIFNTTQDSLVNPNRKSDAFLVGVAAVAGDGATGVATLNGLSPDEGDSYLLNTNVMLLPVPAAALGLRNGASRFRYRVTTYSNDWGDTDDKLVDSTPPSTFDPAAPALALTGSPTGADPLVFADRQGTEIVVRLDPATYFRDPTSGVLLVHHQNANGERTETIAVSYAWPRQYYLPLAGK
jgi:subtilisin family serine protease